MKVIGNSAGEHHVMAGVAVDSISYVTRKDQQLLS